MKAIWNDKVIAEADKDDLITSTAIPRPLGRGMKSFLQLPL